MGAASGPVAGDETATEAEADPTAAAQGSDASGAALEHSASSFTINRNIEQIVHVCVPHKKPRLLLRFILRVREKEKTERVRNPGPMIIFCSKIKTLNFVVAFLERHGVTAQKMHGQLDQKLRERTLAEFKAVSISLYRFLCNT
jgi:superfamily II DNA/RNA helicase